jgi:hypothetical protein
VSSRCVRARQLWICCNVFSERDAAFFQTHGAASHHRRRVPSRPAASRLVSSSYFFAIRRAEGPLSRRPTPCAGVTALRPCTTTSPTSAPMTQVPAPCSSRLLQQASDTFIHQLSNPIPLSISEREKMYSPSVILQPSTRIMSR